MKILVTGAAGFIGSHVVDLLLQRGEKQIFGVDDLSGGFLRNVDKRCQFTKLDLRDTDAVNQYISRIKPDLIYHLAADAAEGRSQFVPISCTQRNYVSFLNLVVPAVKNGMKKIVIISSMSVYGGLPAPFSEDVYPHPEDIYGINKFAMEKSTQVLSEVFGFKYVIIRPHNVYGPKQNFSDPYRNVVAIFINSIMNKKPFFIYGDGQQKRAFTYIDDCAPYIVKAGFVEEANSQIINIGPEEEYTINQLSELVLKKFFGDKVPKEFEPKHLPLRPQEVVEAFCTVDVAKRILGYKTGTSLKEGIDKTIDWITKLGPQKPIYIEKFELENSKLPQTWKKKLI